ncbi:MAG: hypothetical protein Ct9H90mP30_0320 [Actinomycetota bacterium]|nr:MAG: hypothetical protein Ct9H90mP30_0320 [Actinomycetota bacterium]
MERAMNVSTVDRAAGITEMEALLYSLHKVEGFLQDYTCSGLTSDQNLLDVLDAKML